MSDASFPVDLKALSVPAAKLIGAVREAVGIPAPPEPARGRKKTKAKANGEAGPPAILARGKAPSDLELRASERLVRREMRRQENIESITKKAVEALPATVSEDPVDGDWIGRFIESCQDIGDEEVQALWARLLAGEIAKPGTISIRTLRVARELARSDLHLFTGLCRFVWVIPGFGLTPIIHDLANPCFEEAGVGAAALPHLAALGLVAYNETGIYSLVQVSSAPAFYYGRSHTISVPGGVKDLLLGRALLSDVGKELAPMTKSSGLEAYRASVVAQWRAAGWEVQE